MSASPPSGFRVSVYHLLSHDQHIATAFTSPPDAMATGGHTSGDAVAGVTISFTIVAAFCTIMRLYTRFFLNKMGGVDDIFIAIATVRHSRRTYDYH